MMSPNEREAPYFRLSAELKNKSWSLDTDFVWPVGHPRGRCRDGYDGVSTGSVWGSAHGSPSYESVLQRSVKFAHEIKRRLSGIAAEFIEAFPHPDSVLPGQPSPNASLRSAGKRAARLSPRAIT